MDPSLKNAASVPNVEVAFPEWWRTAVQLSTEALGPSPVPHKFSTATLAGIPQPKLRELVRNYGKHFFQLAPRGIAPLLLGPMAAYKSYAAAVLGTTIEQHAKLKIEWVDCPVLLNKFERRRFDTQTDAHIERLKTSGWLVMDDFAFVRLGTWQSDLMAEIACYRFDNSMPICWTGNVNLQLDEQTPLAILSEVVGGQLARRMLEASEGFRLMVKRP